MTTALIEPPAESRPYRPHGSALSIWRDRRPEIVLCGPAGTGKSRACLEKVHACCQHWPGSRWLVVRKTRESVTESALVTWEEKVLPEDSPVADGPQRRLRQSYRYPNGSEVVVGGLDKPSKIMSTEWDGIYVQEAIELAEDDWESLTTRLRNGVMPFQQILGDTNPGPPTHWLKRRADSGRTVLYESRHEDNPLLWDADGGDWTATGRAYLAKLENLTGVRYERLRKGRWAAAEGLVYEEFDPAVHLIDPFPIPPQWRRIRSVDFGYKNAFVCQWWGLDHDDRMFLYREIYRTGRIVADHAQEILRLSQGERIEATVCDHDAEDRATLHAAGIATVSARKSVLPGIQAVQKRLRPFVDGKPRLRLLRGATVGRDPVLEEAKRPCSTAEEFDGYTWVKSGDGRPVKEEPVKVNDHGMDALRYAVAYVDTPAAAATGRWTSYDELFGDGWDRLTVDPAGAW